MAFPKHYVTATIVALLASNAAFAQEGFVGLSFSGIDGENTEGGSSDAISGAFATLDGSLAYDVNAFRLVIDAKLRQSDLSEFDTGGDTGELSSALLTAHALYGLNQTTWLGGFLTGGVADNDDDDGEYDLAGFGLEAHYRINNDFTAYGQLAGFEASRDADSPNGTQDAAVLRIGGTYEGLANTTLYADLQLATSADYEDNGEDYDFTVFGIGGETFIAGTQFAATYDLSVLASQTQNEPADGDEVQLTELGIGVRYYFGGSQSARTSGQIGAPSVISEANIFSEFHD